MVLRSYNDLKDYRNLDSKDRIIKEIGSRRRTRDLSSRRRLGGLYNKNSSLKTELI